MMAGLTDPFPPKDACSVLLSRPVFLEEEMMALFSIKCIAATSQVPTCWPLPF